MSSSRSDSVRSSVRYQNLTLKYSNFDGSMYRVSTKTVSTFVFWISRLPDDLEIPSWTFFNCPFRANFKNIQLFIIWWNLAGDICKILWGGHFKNQHFLFIFGSSASAHMSSHELSWALMCTYLRLWALMSVHRHPWSLLRTNGYGAFAPWALMSAHYALALWSSVLICTNDRFWVLMSAHSVIALC